KHKVAGFGGFECDLGRFQIAHFADENYFRRLAKSGTQRGREIFCIGADLALVDRAFLVVMKKFDRVFDRYDVVAFRFVYAVDDRRKRRTFSRTGRAGKQNNAVADAADIGKLKRNVERFETRNFVRNNAHYDRKRIPLLKDIYAKTAFAGQRIAEIRGARSGKLGGGFGIVAEYRR